MTAVQKVAIAGSGVAGLAAAIQLAKAGVDVDVFEAKPELSALGSGISLQGNALRVFDALGAWDDIRAAGYPFEGLNLRAPGPGAPIVAELPTSRPADRTTRPRWACRVPTSPASSSITPSVRERTCASARRSPASTHGGRRRRGVRRRRVGRRVRPPDRRRRPQLDRPRPHRHRDEARADRAWESGARSSRAPPTSSAPSCTTAARSTSPATRRPARTAMYAFLVEKARGPVRHLRRRGDAHHARGVARLRRPVELDPRRPRSRRARELHLVHEAHRRGPVEPRPRRSSSGMPRTAALRRSRRARPRVSRTPSS